MRREICHIAGIKAVRNPLVADQTCIFTVPAPAILFARIENHTFETDSQESQHH